MYGHRYSKSMDQAGKVTNPARGQLNREINISLPAFVRVWEFGLARRVWQSSPAVSLSTGYGAGNAPSKALR